MFLTDRSNRFRPFFAVYHWQLEGINVKSAGRDVSCIMSQPTRLICYANICTLHPLVKDHAVTQPSVGTKQQIRFLSPHHIVVRGK